MTKPTLREIPIGEIAESPHNPRRAYDEASLEELADSIREQGVLEPLLVRPRVRDGEERPPGTFFPFELVAGHRRLRGARRAGLAEVPCIVREMDDAQALEAALVENNHREDVTPLDEAQAFARLVALGRTVEDVASRIGRSVGYVRSRLRLLELVPEVRALLDAKRIYVGSALLLAQVPEARQRELAERIEKGAYRPRKNVRDPWSSADVSSLLHDSRRRVSLAIWPLDDDELVPDVGACTTCPKRTGSQRALLAEMEGEDQCLDAQCWAGKTAATLAAARARGELVLEGPALQRADDSRAFFDLGDDVDEDDFEEVYERPTKLDHIISWGDALGQIGAVATEWTLAVDETGRVDRMVSAGHVADLIESTWPDAARILRLRVRDWNADPRNAPAPEHSSEGEKDAVERDDLDAQAHAEEERARDAEKAKREREKADREKAVEERARASMMRELVSYAEAEGRERLAWWVGLTRVVAATVSHEACLSVQKRREIPAGPEGTAGSWDAAKHALDAWLVTANSIGEVRGVMVELLAHAGLRSQWLFAEDDPNGTAGPYKILSLLRETRGDDDEPGIEPGAEMRRARKAIADEEYAAKHAAKKASDKAAKKKVANAKKAREVRDGA